MNRLAPDVLPERQMKKVRLQTKVLYMICAEVMLGSLRVRSAEMRKLKKKIQKGLTLNFLLPQETLDADHIMA